jgi:hypothetical protein
MSATKKGAVLRSTEAMAAPASRVPSAIPASVRTTLPREMPVAHAQPRSVRGSDAPRSRRMGSMTTPPISARVVEMTDALVTRSAAAVTG